MKNGKFIKSGMRVVMAAQLSVLVGSACVAALIGFWPGSTVPLSLELFISIFLIAFPVVNFFSLAGFFPAYLCGKVDVSSGKFVMIGAISGGAIYLLINVVIAVFSGSDTFRQFFATNAFIFPLVVGALYAGLFCACCKVLLDRGRASGT